jgi:hypothetical protein
MRWVYRIIVRFKMDAKQRREDGTLSRMSTLELQDIGYPHRLKSSPRSIPELPLINFDALSRHAKLRHSEK